MTTKKIHIEDPIFEKGDKVYFHDKDKILHEDGIITDLEILTDYIVYTVEEKDKTYQCRWPDIYINSI
jgi:hypothetical protein